jgi:hypothetical protein
MLGTFRWGLQNGEGTCQRCGWPGRGLHDPKKNGESVFNRRLEIILQYHPDGPMTEKQIKELEENDPGEATV